MINYLLMERDSKAVGYMSSDRQLAGLAVEVTHLLLFEAECITDIIYGIRAMGDLWVTADDKGHASGDTHSEQVLLQTIEVVLQFAEGKSVEKFSC